MSDVPARDREVVAGAIFRGGRLLLAQRTSPPALAGRWELPGGKVEEFETPQAALARELREELAVEVRCGARIGVDVQLSAGLVLRAYRAELVSGERSRSTTLSWHGSMPKNSCRWIWSTTIEPGSPNCSRS
jgi:8-oxo-dGTP diphosphatase